MITLIYLLPYLIGIAPLLNLVFDLLTGGEIDPVKTAISIALGIGLIIFTIVDHKRIEKTGSASKKHLNTGKNVTKK